MPLISADGETMEARDFGILPNGYYPMIIAGQEVKTTKAGTGKYLNVEFEIIDGEHKGRKQWNNYNFDNPNKTAVEIAEKELRTILQSVGLKELNDWSELNNHTLVVQLGSKAAGYNGEPENTFKGYFPLSKLDELTKPKPLNNPIPKDSEIPF